MLATHLSPDFVKRMGVLPCDGCGAVEPGHPCHLAPLVDHRPKSSACVETAASSSLSFSLSSMETSRIPAGRMERIVFYSFLRPAACGMCCFPGGPTTSMTRTATRRGCIDSSTFLLWPARERCGTGRFRLCACIRSCVRVFVCALFRVRVWLGAAQQPRAVPPARR